jgi:hypothetical protein
MGMKKEIEVVRMKPKEVYDKSLKAFREMNHEDLAKLCSGLFLNLSQLFAIENVPEGDREAVIGASAHNITTVLNIIMSDSPKDKKITQFVVNNANSDGSGVS